VPEILRSDLSQLCLALRVMEIEHFSNIDWLDGPPDKAVKDAEVLLDRLGATGKMVQQLARYPLPPRLSRILVESLERGGERMNVPQWRCSDRVLARRRTTFSQQ
jgi:ATP-dependent helicase HrpB